MADCSGWIEPLDLECILVNTFAGTMDIFIFICIIAIAGMASYFRMMNSTLLIMFGIFAVLMAQYMSGLYFLAVLIAGLLTAFAVGRFFKA